jgi:hypothetical protein
MIWAPLVFCEYLHLITADDFAFAAGHRRRAASPAPRIPPRPSPSRRPPRRQLTAWSVYKIAKKAVWLGIVETPNEQAAIEKAAEEFLTLPRAHLCAPDRCSGQPFSKPSWPGNSLQWGAQYTAAGTNPIAGCDCIENLD